MDIRDRIVDWRKVPARTIKPDPRNWRRHPEEQQSALVESMERIGDVTAVYVREDANGDLVLIDGHLRAGLDADRTINALVTDLTEEEAAVALVSIDPISAMAEFDEPALRALVTTLNADAEPLAMLAQVDELYDLGALADVAGAEPAAGETTAHAVGGNGDGGPGGVTGITKPVIIDVPEERYSEFVAQLNALADLHCCDTWHEALIRELG